MTPNGGIPADNPFTASYVYAYGLRNAFGLALDPGSGRLWATDNGPLCNDEVNRINEAGNYGWGPSATCDSPPPAPRNTSRDGASPILPQACSPASVGFTGLAFCEGCGLGGFYESTLFYGSFVTKEIRNLKLSSSRLSVVADRLALRPGRRVLALERAPDGTLYYSSVGAIWRLEKI